MLPPRGISWSANISVTLQAFVFWKWPADAAAVRQLAKAGACVTGCDFSSAALHASCTKVFAPGRPPLAALVQGGAQSLPFADNSFDAVISCETIEHLPQVQAGVNEMYRVTRPGGRLFLTTPNYFNFIGLYEI